MYLLLAVVLVLPKNSLSPGERDLDVYPGPLNTFLVQRSGKLTLVNRRVSSDSWQIPVELSIVNPLNYIQSSSNRRQFVVWQFAHKEFYIVDPIFRTVERRNVPYGLAEGMLSPDGRFVAISSASSPTICGIFSLSDPRERWYYCIDSGKWCGDQLPRLSHATPRLLLSFHPRKPILYLLKDQADLILVNYADKTSKQILQLPSTLVPYGMQLSNDGEYLAIYGSMLHVYSTRSMQLVASLSPHRSIVSLSFTPNSKGIVYIDARPVYSLEICGIPLDTTLLQYFHISSGRASRVVKLSNDPSWYLEFDADGEFLLQNSTFLYRCRFPF